MESKTEPTFTVEICIAGDLEQAKQVCREYTFDVGLCVTVTPTAYIYTGGEESGVLVRLVNYPRFPASAVHLLATAKNLAELLCQRLCQWSYLLMTPNESEWISHRADQPPQGK